jgi:hypothetical protein
MLLYLIFPNFKSEVVHTLVGRAYKNGMDKISWTCREEKYEF